MTGYELNKEFNESLGNFWQVKSQQIYKELDAMEKSGWLISERIIQSEKPNKRVYSITVKGKEEFLIWLSSPELDIKTSMQAKNVFLMRLFFAGETNNEQALSFLHSFREECLAGIKKMDDVKEVIARDEIDYNHDIVKYWKLTALHGEMMLQTRLDWVDKAIAMLENEK